MAGAMSHRIRRPLALGGGFTLIEFIAVMVVLAILAAAAVPTLNSVGSTRSAMAGKQLLRDLSYARQRAVATGARSWVIIDANAETWSVLAENPLNPGRANAAVVPDFATGKNFTVSLGIGEYQGIGIASCNFDGGGEIGFDWLGKPLNSASTSLAANGAVVLSGGHQIIVHAHTGHIDYAAP